jgi:hypothetical protein
VALLSLYLLTTPSVSPPLSLPSRITSRIAPLSLVYYPLLPPAARPPPSLGALFLFLYATPSRLHPPPHPHTCGSLRLDLALRLQIGSWSWIHVKCLTPSFLVFWLMTAVWAGTSSALKVFITSLRIITLPGPSSCWVVRTKWPEWRSAHRPMHRVASRSRLPLRQLGFSSLCLILGLSLLSRSF